MRRKYTVWMEGIAREIEEGAAWDAFRADYKFVPAAGGAVTDEHGRLLVIRRLGKWDLPKGKVDKGEAIDAAAMREVREECGLSQLRIEAAMLSTWHTYERKGKQYLKRTDWFLMRGSSLDRLAPQNDEDIEVAKWIPRTELISIEHETYPSLIAVLREWQRMTAPH